MKKNAYETFCTGCGLCHSLYSVELEIDKKGYPTPRLGSNKLDYLDSICMVSGEQTKYMKPNIWGGYEHVYSGWSKSDYIRKMASSGGVLTEICLYLLENNLVDGIIQTKVSKNKPYETVTVLSKNENDVMECMGSRYSISSPLKDIKELIKEQGVYAIVAKPCDIATLRMAQKIDKELKEKIKYCLSFFCAGMPSVDAQKKLVNELNCAQLIDCVQLQYRGNGWPGYTTLTHKDGKVSKIKYGDSWGKILGRDVRKSCRFCIDGIGEFADISCGDYWYIENNKPSFDENNGRSIIFTRTKKGDDLLNELINNKKLEVDSANVEELKIVQKYQYERKVFMKSMIAGLRLCGKEYPKYNKELIKQFSKSANLISRLRRSMGIVKRVIRGKI